MPRRTRRPSNKAPAQENLVRLRHVNRTGNFMFYAYDGEMKVEDGIIAIPAEKPEWIRRAWITGFRMNVEGRVIVNLDAHIKSETAGNDDVAAAAKAESENPADKRPTAENKSTNPMVDEATVETPTPVETTDVTPDADTTADVDSTVLNTPATASEND